MRSALTFQLDKILIGVACGTFLILGHATAAAGQQITSYALLDEASHLTKAAIPQLRNRAESGDTHAQILLGTSYEYGLSVRQNDSTATGWFLRVARQGDTLGEVLLGQTYQRQGKQSDAFSWFRQAADQGNPEAQFELAKAYERGWGVAADEGQAEALYRMAADNGFSPARCSLQSQSPEYPRVRSNSTGTKPPHAIYTPDPEYSERARKAKLMGSAELWVGVGADGLVHDLCVSQPLGLGLDDKSVEAVRQWRFNPATRNGQPVAVGLTVTTTFRLY